jgi:hypothetical protein
MKNSGVSLSTMRTPRYTKKKIRYINALKISGSRGLFKSLFFNKFFKKLKFKKIKKVIFDKVIQFNTVDRLVSAYSRLLNKKKTFLMKKKKALSFLFVFKKLLKLQKSSQIASPFTSFLYKKLSFLARRAQKRKKKKIKFSQNFLFYTKFALRTYLRKKKLKKFPNFLPATCLFLNKKNLYKSFIFFFITNTLKDAKRFVKNKPYTLRTTYAHHSDVVGSVVNLPCVYFFKNSKLLYRTLNFFTSTLTAVRVKSLNQPYPHDTRLNLKTAYSFYSAFGTTPI